MLAAVAILAQILTYRASIPSDSERVLIAVSGIYPGASNSTWSTELSVHNSSDRSFTLSQAVPEPEHFGCLLCFQRYVFGSVVVNEGMSAMDISGGPTPGLLIYISPKPSPETLHFDLLARNATFEWGTEIPVVREEQFRTGTTELMNIPIDRRYRAMLRVYDVDNVQDGADTAVRVRRYVHFANGEALVDETTLPLHETNVPGAPYPLFPGYGTWSGITSYQSAAADTMRIEIEPVTPGLHYWAFVSVTNNDTQNITVISPN